jgi:hypothetical protein
MSLDAKNNVTRSVGAAGVTRKRTLESLGRRSGVLQPLAEPANVRHFHQLRQQAIAQQNCGEPPKIGEGQGYHAQVRPQRRERQVNPEGHDARGQQDDRRGRAALNERHMLRPDHVHDQCLRQQALNEPTRLEQRLTLNRVGKKHLPHDEIGYDVEDGAYGANEHHEARDATGIPFAWLPEIVSVNIIPRDRNLRNIVKQILHEQLDRQHREEWQEDAGDDHAENVAEVRARGHLDVFDDVGEGLAAFHHRFLQHQKALFQQNDVGRLLGDVDRGVYRNPNIRILEGCRIIDAISQVANGMPVPLQRANDARFLDGRHLREDRSRLGRFLELNFGQFFDVLAQYCVLDGQTHLFANLAGNNFIVAGDNLDRYTMLAQRRDGLPRRGVNRRRRKAAYIPADD